MRHLATLAFCFLTSVQICSADLFSSLFGKWTLNEDVPDSSATAVYKRLEKKGLISTTTVVLPDSPKGILVLRYHDNGKLDGEAKSMGIVGATFSGTWQVDGKSLRTNMKISSPRFPTISQKTRTTLANPDKITYVVTAKDGSKTVNTYSRKKRAGRPGDAILMNVFRNAHPKP